MSMEHLPGSIVSVLNGDFEIAGEVEVQVYLHNQKSYKVWWTYPQTGERQLISVPEWRLIKKRKTIGQLV
ncbi:MAG: hypothetical protein ABI581_17305 [Sediminibacterium sp.]